MINIYRSRHDWKPVNGGSRTKAVLCPRCKNEVEYYLAWDGTGWGVPGIFTIAITKVYAFKCPICPCYEELSAEVAKAIVKGD